MLGGVPKHLFHHEKDSFFVRYNIFSLSCNIRGLSIWTKHGSTYQHFINFDYYFHTCYYLGLVSNLFTFHKMIEEYRQPIQNFVYGHAERKGNPEIKNYLPLLRM